MKMRQNGRQKPHGVSARALTGMFLYERDRFEVVGMSGFIDAIVTDRKTGCQYLVFTGNGYAVEPLGCFDEYKKK